MLAACVSALSEYGRFWRDFARIAADREGQQRVESRNSNSPTTDGRVRARLWALGRPAQVVRARRRASLKRRAGLDNGQQVIHKPSTWHPYGWKEAGSSQKWSKRPKARS